VIRPTDIEFLHAPLSRSPEEAANPVLPTLRDAERAHIIRVLDAAGWNKVEAARILDISRGTLYRKIEEFGLEPTATDAKRRSRKAE
jgi:two-component system response regulator HydG